MYALPGAIRHVPEASEDGRDRRQQHDEVERFVAEGFIERHEPLDFGVELPLAERRRRLRRRRRIPPR